MPVDPGEIHRLRTALRDLVALSTIPAGWVGREPPAIAAGLADVLAGSLHLDFAFVRLCDPNGGAAVDVTRGEAWPAFPEWLQRHLAAVGPWSRKAIIPDVGGGRERCRGLVIPIGVNADGGLVAVACDRIDFPTETDQLLLSVAANHAATAFQSARLIHERRRAEEELRQARDELEIKVTERTGELRRTTAELQTILDASPVGIALLRRDQTVQRCNPAFERLVGWRADEIVGRRVPLPEKIEKRWTPLLAQLDRGEGFSGLEIPIMRKDGSEFDAALACAPLADERGWPAGFVANIEDISDRRRAEQELRESERRYRYIFESTGVSIWEEDFSEVKCAIDGLKARGVRDLRQYFAEDPQFVQDAISMVKIIDVNDATVRLFAAENKDELLVSLEKIFVAETREVFAGELIAIAEGRASFEAETVVQTLKAERLTALLTITFPPPPTRFDRVLVTLTDITERKRAEYLTGQVFESSPDGMSIVGRDYRFQRVNPVYERDFGRPAQRIVGMHVADVLGMDVFAQTVKPSLDRCFSGEEARFTEWFVRSRDRRYMAVSLSPLRPDSERVEAALVIARDLTDHVRASEALQKAQAELAHVTRVATLGELAASIAHEINQPLAAIVADANASLNWLGGPRPDLDVVRDALTAIVKDGHRAGDVIQGVRQLASKRDPQMARSNVNDVIRDVVPLVRTEVLSHQVSLQMELAPALPDVLADRVQLQQVIINLVMNGIEAMASVADRQRELAIRSRLHDGDQVLVAVQDAGIGIDPDNVNRLFNAFFTTKPGGMGMGLSVSRSIIEAHGGRLWATPGPTHGATFLFVLPGMR